MEKVLLILRSTSSNELTLDLPFAFPTGPCDRNGVPFAWQQVGSGPQVPIGFQTAGRKATWAVDLPVGLDILRSMKGREPKRPVYTRIPGFNINSLPAGLRKAIFKTFFMNVSAEEPNLKAAYLVQRLGRWLGDNLIECPELKQLCTYRWPDRKRAGLVITLDADSDFAFRSPENAVLDLLEKHALKTAWFIVTGRYPIPHRSLRELKGMGHEVGWHSDRHDHKLAFLSPKKQKNIFERLVPFFERYEVSGMRCDNFLWSRSLHETAANYFRYDTSFLDGFPSTIRGESSGNCLPFKMDCGLYQLPTTLSVDLFLPEAWTIDRKAHFMRQQIDDVISLGGLAHLLIHPEPSISLTKNNLELLKETLSYLESRRADLWNGTPESLVEYAEMSPQPVRPSRQRDSDALDASA